MAHCDLAFEFTSGIKSNADNDNYRGAAKYQCSKCIDARPRKENRENCHKGKEYRTHKGYTVNYLLDIITILLVLGHN